MHRVLALSLAAILTLTAACSDSPAEPQTVDTSADALAAEVAYSAAAPDPFPDSLRLSDEQKARIASLTQEFQAATAADRAAVEAIVRQARERQRAGGTRDEVRAILETARPIQQRIGEAHRELRAQILAVFTAAQRAWLEERRNRCTAEPMPPLTDAQRAQIAALVEAFEQTHRADLLLVRAIQAEVRAARDAGKSDAEIRAILERGREAHARIAAAQRQLQAAIEAILPARAPRCGLRMPG